MIQWTEEQIAELPERGGYRLRGQNMTRIEVFSDAAFAFAVTMLVISVDEIPGSYEQLIQAMLRVPSFAASFAVMMAVWLVNRRWSERFGLEDGVSTVLTLALVFVVLVYLYPLKLVMDLTFYGLAPAWFPTGLAVASQAEVAGLVAIFSAGLFLVAMIQLGLYQRAAALSKSLCLSPLEQLLVKREQILLAVQAGCALLATCLAILLVSSVGYLAGIALGLIPALLPLATRNVRKDIRELQARSSTPS